MKIISQISSGSDWTNPDFDSVMFDMTPQLAEALLSKIRLVRSMEADLPGLYGVEIFDTTAQFGARTATAEVPDFFDDAMASNQWVAVPPSITLVERSVQVSTLHVCKDRVYWSAVPKHYGSRDYLESEPLFYSQLEEYLATLPQSVPEGE